MPSYFLAHMTDSALGRTGTTLDWPKSLDGAVPEEWGNYVHHPPLDWDWHNALPASPHLVARNSVKPFAMFFEALCNLLFIAEPIVDAMDWKTTADRAKKGTIAFGKKVFPYQLVSLTNANLLREPSAYSDENAFDLYERNRYHIFGTRKQRGEASAEDAPLPTKTNLMFSSLEEYRAFQRQDFGNRLVPTRLHFKARQHPHAFSTGLNLYLSEDLAKFVAEQPTPGLSFPYDPVFVTGLGP